MVDKLTSALFYLSHPFLWHRREYLFILGHMRCYSTLLSHILGTHPSICGYAEMHQSYYRRPDLWRLQLRLKQAGVHPGRKRLILDKVLHHANYPIAPAILSAPYVHVILIVRRPEASIRSILHMQEKLTKNERRMGEADVIDYYCNQLTYLADTARLLKRRALYINGEELIDDTQTVLGAVQRFLELERPISSEYDCFQHTGERGFGDPSDTIRSGTIRHEKSNYSDITISDAHIERAEQAYASCVAALRSHCTVATGVVGE